MTCKHCDKEEHAQCCGMSFCEEHFDDHVGPLGTSHGVRCGWCEGLLVKSKDIALCECGESYCISSKFLSRPTDCLAEHKRSGKCANDPRSRPCPGCDACGPRGEVAAMARDVDAPSCALPPAGWVCSRGEGHDGPCAAMEQPTPIRPDLKAVDIMPYKTAVNENTVNLLEKLLKEARSGELQEVVAIGILTDGSIASIYTPSVNFVTRLGAIEHVKLRWFHNEILHDGQVPEKF